MYSIWHTGDMQYPLQPYLQHLQDRYLEPLQIQKAIKNQFLQLHLESGQLLQSHWDLQKYWLAFLVVFVIAKVGYSVTLVFYDSMLVDVTLEDRMDEVSSQGYAWGYIGSCVPFVICLLVVLNAGKIGITMEIAMMVSFVIITVWWVIMTLPLLRTYHQKYYVEKKQHAFFRKLQKNRHYSEKCKEGEEGFSVSSGVFLLY